jgi:hypothetical protein
MPTPSQKGTPLKVTASPKFSAFVVEDGSWKEKDATEHQEFKNGESETENLTFFNPGIEATCTWVIKDASTPAAKGDVVAEASPSTRKWVVLEAETSEFGGKPLKQNVTLYSRESLTLA